jgi:C4-dicarboxylate-specific signal transduction histidine kinase
MTSMASNLPGATGAPCSLQYFDAAAAAIRVAQRALPLHLLHVPLHSENAKRRQSGAALPDAQGELARVARVTVMGEFAASIAHELNQPLAAIVLNAAAALKWLDQDPPQLAQARAALSAILDAGTNASEVIRSMNDMARKSAPEQTVFALDDAIAEVLLLLRAKLHKHRVEVHTDFAPDQRQLRANRAQLKQVMMNLFLNAIEAMGGVSDRPRVLEVRSEVGAAAGTALISLADNGCGIAPNAAERLFDPLFSTRPNGMGMGLSICRSIVEAHGGRIWSSPRHPHGTVFQLSLPATPHPSAILASASATPAP